MKIFHRIKHFFRYLWVAQSKYYIHSPFVYQFYLNVLERKPDVAIDRINAGRSFLAKSKDFIYQTDLGTGKSHQRKLSMLESQVAVRPKYGEVLFRLARYLKPENVVELGTSVGISSGYLALGNDSAKVITLEGSKELTAQARLFHQFLNVSNVTYLEGNINNTLPELLADLKQVDLAFIDSNHSKQATLNYFESFLPYVHSNSVLVFDDIYWSAEMTEAWMDIKKHSDVKLTLDIYQFGIVFFRKENVERDSFTLRY
ncbi:MAG: class I SAM-dependent methyltransferase [Bacteroidetes bacterium]|nr:class I SAM-dependent methyltransferase [Bacteroidota bacterium]